MLGTGQACQLDRDVSLLIDVTKGGRSYKCFLMGAISIILRHPLLLFDTVIIVSFPVNS